MIMMGNVKGYFLISHWHKQNNKSKMYAQKLFIHIFFFCLRLCCQWTVMSYICHLRQRKIDVLWKFSFLFFCNFLNSSIRKVFVDANCVIVFLVLSCFNFFFIFSLRKIYSYKTRLYITFCNIFFFNECATKAGHCFWPSSSF